MNRNELEELYNLYEKKLYNFALRWVFNPSLAEELVHEAFIKLWKKSESQQLAHPKAFLFRCLQNLAINHLKRQKLAMAFDFSGFWGFGPTENEDLERGTSTHQELIQMATTLNKIPHKYREVLLLSYYGDMSNQEIAKTLKIAEGTVASRKNRALNLLKGELTQLEVTYV